MNIEWLHKKPYNRNSTRGRALAGSQTNCFLKQFIYGGIPLIRSLMSPKHLAVLLRQGQISWLKGWNEKYTRTIQRIRTSWRNVLFNKQPEV